jgi:hypothetical protein
MLKQKCHRDSFELDVQDNELYSYFRQLSALYSQLTLIIKAFNYSRVNFYNNIDVPYP